MNDRAKESAVQDETNDNPSHSPLNEHQDFYVSC